MKFILGLIAGIALGHSLAARMESISAIDDVASRVNSITKAIERR